MTAEEKKAYLQKALQNSVLVMKETDKKMSEIKMLMQKGLLLELKQILGLNKFSSE